MKLGHNIGDRITDLGFEAVHNMVGKNHQLLSSQLHKRLDWMRRSSLLSLARWVIPDLLQRDR